MVSPARSMHLMSPAQFEDFRDDLAEALHARMEQGQLVWECDHTFRQASAWLEAHGLNLADHLAVFELRSVFCDCEILLNIEEWPPFDEQTLSQLMLEGPA